MYDIMAVLCRLEGLEGLIAALLRGRSKLGGCVVGQVLGAEGCRGLG